MLLTYFKTLINKITVNQITRTFVPKFALKRSQKQSVAQNGCCLLLVLPVPASADYKWICFFQFRGAPRPPPPVPRLSDTFRLCVAENYVQYNM